MSITVAGREIRKVHVIDDDKASREGYALTVEEVDVETILQEDKVENVADFFRHLDHLDAIVSDHHLKRVSSYFPINGAELASNCYDRGIPSLLVTRYEKSSVHEIRPFRNKIPVVLTPDKFNPESLVASLSECVDELMGNISVGRKTWRTLIRIDGCDEYSVVVFIPSWNRSIAVDLRWSEFPDDIAKILKPDLRIHASVNLDAEDISELFFTAWEPK